MPEGLGRASHASAKGSVTCGRVQINGKCVQVKCILYPDPCYRVHGSSTCLLLRRLSIVMWTECLCPSQTPMLKSTPHVKLLESEALGRSWGHEDGVFMNGIIAYKKKKDP